MLNKPGQAFPRSLKIGTEALPLFVPPFTDTYKPTLQALACFVERFCNLAPVLVNGNAYSLLKLLGKGKGGYSYLAQMADGQQVGVKQIHHEPCVYYQFGNKIEAELRDYNHLQEIGIPMPRMLDVDTKAERIVKEYIAGETVYTLVLKDALPETCLRQVQAMCRLLYPAHTNIDYFLTNFILQGDTLYYIDYECNDYMDEWNFENWGCKYWAKTPEFLQYAAEHP